MKAQVFQGDPFIRVRDINLAREPSSLCTNHQAKGHDVKLVTIDRSNIDAFCPLDKRVVQIGLGSHRAVVCRDFNFLFMHSERRKWMLSQNTNYK
jgi:hypothetical protein